MRRSYYILTIIGIIAVGALIAYLLRSSQQASPPPDDPDIGTLPPVGPPVAAPTPPPGETPTPPTTPTNQRFGSVLDEPVIDYFVDSQNIATVLATDGRVLQVKDGNLTTFHPKTTSSPLIASFSSDGQKIMAQFSRETPASRFDMFDVQKRAWLWQPKPLLLESPVWSPVTSTLIYLRRLENDRGAVLSIQDLSNQASKPLEVSTLHQQDLTLAWPDPTYILLQQKSSVLYPGSLWKFDILRKTLSPIIMTQPGLETIWDPRSKQGVGFVGNTNERGGRLFLFNESGATTRQFSTLTLPSKCAFHTAVTPVASTVTSSGTPQTGTLEKTTLYCAIPRDPQTLSTRQLPDLYYKKGLFTSDDIYSIDLASGSITPLLTDPAYQFDAQSVRVINDKLFFISRLDKKLYALMLGL